jgi:hypothetical protein
MGAAGGGGMGGMNVGSIISGLINTGVQVWAANEQKGALSNAANSIQAAPYKPVDFTQQQQDTVKGNLDNLNYIKALDKNSNKFITKQMMQRINTLTPGFTQGLATYGHAGESLLRGQLPYSDVLDSLSSSGELANTVGIPGSSLPFSLKDLGLTQLQGIETGGGILGDITKIAQGIAPTQDYNLPQQMFLTPDETVPWAMQQNQLIQQSNQGLLNAASQRAYAHAAADNMPWNALAASSTQAMNAYNGTSGGGQSSGGNFRY